MDSFRKRENYRNKSNVEPESDQIVNSLCGSAIVLLKAFKSS
jgi:hypothetical protein